MSLMMKFAEVQCDECSVWIETAVQTLRVARKQLAHEGWTHKGHMDYCPKCSRAKAAGGSKP